MLPIPLIRAFTQQAWSRVKVELSTVMDSTITDGVYGRALLQLVLALPSDIDPVLDRYRVAAMLDHGDWDGIRGQSAESSEVRGMREVLMARLDQTALPTWDNEIQRRLFEIYEYQARRATGSLRHWVERIVGWYPEEMWRRNDIAIGRHLRYRQLHDTMIRAITESQGGRLEVAFGLASEGQQLGDESEQFRSVAHDLSGLVRLAMGDRPTFDLEVPRRICEPTGPSPIGSWEMLLYLMPLLPLRDDESLEWASSLAAYVAARIASPRWQLQSDSWRVASDLRSGKAGNRTALAGLVARSRRATPGLRALPLFLNGLSQRRYDTFSEAARLARESGNVWLQLSAMAWMSAIDPRPQVGRRLRQLLEVTGWRRLVLVPSEI